ncbi:MULTISPECIES: septum formation family protein [Dietzia]|uniref:septum formation family protein n=1 Tax=Dietzia TaxID=37914 RepID=UPI001F50E54A|nr:MULTISPECIES: septum formation family protein [Dietzia]MCT1516623.1 septum formation family protein [Dietzia cercidiphylli]
MITSSRSPHPGRSLLRTRGAVMASLVAILSGGAITGGLMASAMGDPNSATAERIAAIVPQVDPRTLSGPAYANAAPGTCLTWQVDAADRVTAFTTVDCAEPHRFEVAGRIDLSGVPGFGENTPLPDNSRLAPIGTDRCLPLITRYAGGREVDPAGRFTGLVVPPSEEGWAKGDHTVLCGVAAAELNGRSTTSTGVFAEADQHRRWDPGTCLGFTDEGLPGAPVPCSEDHAIEVVSDVDVSGLFPDAPTPPEPRVQSELTADACLAAGTAYLGDGEALRRTTLISTLVNPISQISWATGSRTVNCGLMRAADPGPFAVLRGSARQGVLIDGSTPVPPTTTEVPPPGVGQGTPGTPTDPDPGTVSVPIPGGTP